MVSERRTTTPSVLGEVSSLRTGEGIRDARTADIEYTIALIFKTVGDGPRNTQVQTFPKAETTCPSLLVWGRAKGGTPNAQPHAAAASAESNTYTSNYGSLRRATLGLKRDNRISLGH